MVTKVPSMVFHGIGGTLAPIIGSTVTGLPVPAPAAAITARAAAELMSLRKAG